jgi:2-methylcitrate dehydratase PrpD
LNGVEAAVEIELSDGARRSARSIHPRGSFENPLARGEIEDKLRTYARGRIADTAVEEVIGMVATLEALPSVRPLMDLLRAAPRRVRAA